MCNRKHTGSRRPSSWREAKITRTKEEAINEITSMRNQLLDIQNREGYDAMFKKFADIAAESDCSSARQSGDLGSFTRGQMQKSFEDASFNLDVHQLSELVDSDSGIHIILRTA